MSTARIDPNGVWVCYVCDLWEACVSGDVVEPESTAIYKRELGACGHRLRMVRQNHDDPVYEKYKAGEVKYP